MIQHIQNKCQIYASLTNILTIAIFSFMLRKRHIAVAIAYTIVHDSLIYTCLSMQK